MRKANYEKTEQIKSVLITREELKSMLHAGEVTSLRIADAAGARVQIGKRVLYSSKKINEYIDAIAQ